MTEPMTEAQLAAIATRYEVSQRATGPGVRLAAIDDLVRKDVPALVAEVRRLQGILAAYGLPLAVERVASRRLGPWITRHRQPIRERAHLWSLQRDHVLSPFKGDRATCRNCMAEAIISGEPGAWYLEGDAVQLRCPGAITAPRHAETP